MDERIMRLFRLGIGVVLVLLLVYFGGIANTLATISSFDLFNPALSGWILLIFAATLIVTWINLKILFDAKYSLESRGFFLDFLASWAIGFMLPGKIGDFSLAYFLKDKIRVGESTAVILLDKVIGIAALSVIGSLAFMLFSEKGVAEAALLLVLLAWLACGFLVFTSNGRGIIKKIVPAKYTEKFAGFSLTLNYFLAKEKKRIALNFLLSIARLVLQAVIMVTIFWGIGISAGVVDITLVLAATTLLSFVPITTSGIGIREGAFAFFTLQLGIPVAASVSASLIGFFFNYLLVLIITIVLFNRATQIIWREPKKIQ
ncbi:MAG: lysylphosphatidylglycerol synthase transmembrane domain-containing protein [archaeon]